MQQQDTTADDELIDLTLASRPRTVPAPLSQQIKYALLADAHAQRSHREVEQYLSEQQVFPLVAQMVEALGGLPA